MTRALLSACIGLLALAAPAYAAGDAANGGKLFAQRCALCHSVKAGETKPMAPNLFGVVGRKAAGAAGFKYSKALAGSGLTWDAATLDAFLTAPSAKVPGTMMPIATAKPQDRADIIAYLATVK